MSSHVGKAASSLAPVFIALGCIAIAVRPPATTAGLAVVVAAGGIGLYAPMPSQEAVRPGWLRWLTVTALGILVFATARFLAAPISPPATIAAAAATGLAAVAEEVFFRRLVYGWLLRWSVLLAVGGTAVAFAVVHVPAYGWRVLPLNLAAGILLGWQRWASGGWSAPAITHLAANLMQLG